MAKTRQTRGTKPGPLASVWMSGISTAGRVTAGRVLDPGPERVEDGLSGNERRHRAIRWAIAMGATLHESGWILDVDGTRLARGWDALYARYATRIERDRAAGIGASSDGTR